MPPFAARGVSQVVTFSRSHREKSRSNRAEEVRDAGARERGRRGNKEALESVKKGIADAKAGRLTKMSFKKYVK